MGRVQCSRLSAQPQVASSSSLTSSCVVLHFLARILKSVPIRSKIIATGPPPLQQPCAPGPGPGDEYWCIVSGEPHKRKVTKKSQGGCFGGGSRCEGLLDGEREEAALGEAPAARGCLIEGERRLLWGSCHCAGLLDRGRENAASGGAPAARGCLIEGGRRMLWGELPLGGAARWREGGGCFGGSSRCVGLLDGEREEAALGGAPAAWGCSIKRGRRLLLGKLPLRGAA